MPACRYLIARVSRRQRKDAIHERRFVGVDANAALAKRSGKVDRDSIIALDHTLEPETPQGRLLP
jgi:hypothetical protein